MAAPALQLLLLASPALAQQDITAFAANPCTTAAIQAPVKTAVLAATAPLATHVPVLPVSVVQFVKSTLTSALPAPVATAAPASMAPTSSLAIAMSGISVFLANNKSPTAPLHLA